MRFYQLYNLFLFSYVYQISLLNFQKRHRGHRDTMIANIVKDFHAHVKNNGIQPVNFRNVFQSELFGLAMKEVSFYVL